MTGHEVTLHRDDTPPAPVWWWVCSCGTRWPELTGDAAGAGHLIRATAVLTAENHGVIVPVGPGGTKYLVCSGDGALSTTPDRDVAARRARNTLGWSAALAVVADFTVEESNV